MGGDVSVGVHLILMAAGGFGWVGVGVGVGIGHGMACHDAHVHAGTFVSFAQSAIRGDLLDSALARHVLYSCAPSSCTRSCRHVCELCQVRHQR